MEPESRARSDDLQHNRARHRRTRSGHDLERTRLDDAAHVDSGQRELVGIDHKRDRAAFARRERDAAEPGEFLDRARDAADHVAQIELDDLVADARADVRYLDGHARALGARDRRTGQAGRADLEACVAQAMPERKQRLRRLEQVAAAPARFMAVE